MTEERKELSAAELNKAEIAGARLDKAEKAGLIAQVATDTALRIVEMLSQVSGQPKATA